MTKSPQFKIKAEDIKPLVEGFGGCFATDMITVDGKRVNFMYREKPHNEIDSGWKFFSGFESEDYINDLNHTRVWDVNTIANYDPDIIPFLKSPTLTAFERNEKTGKFEQILDFEFPED
jgi:hypothetical protein